MPRNDYYVYVYIDPRDYQPFYYGKGRGSRKQAHLLEDDGSEKFERISEIVAKVSHPPFGFLLATLFVFSTYESKKVHWVAAVSG